MNVYRAGDGSSPAHAGLVPAFQNFFPQNRTNVSPDTAQCRRRSLSSADIDPALHVANRQVPFSEFDQMPACAPGKKN